MCHNNGFLQYQNKNPDTCYLKIVVYYKHALKANIEYDNKMNF